MSKLVAFRKYMVVMVMQVSSGYLCIAQDKTELRQNQLILCDFPKITNAKPDRGTTDAIFISLSYKKSTLLQRSRFSLNWIKAFDRVPRKVIWWIMRSLDVEEWAVCIVKRCMLMFRSRIRINDQYSE